MRRLFFFALAALLVFALTVPAMAAEVYEFEYMEMPVALSESFDFSEYDSMLIYEGILPPGVYDGSLTDGDTVFSFGAPVSLAFDMYDPGSGYWGTFAIVQLLDAGIAFDVPMAFVLMDGVTVVLIDGLSSGSTLTLTRVGDLPSQGGLLEDVASFGSGVISQVGSIASVITNNPLILLTVGLLFIGGCVGITGRLFSRR